MYTSMKIAELGHHQGGTKGATTNTTSVHARMCVHACVCVCMPPYLPQHLLVQAAVATARENLIKQHTGSTSHPDSNSQL